MPGVVVVTGAAGFIGSQLVQRLAEQGHSVAAVVRRPEQADRIARRGVKVHLADVSRPQSLHAPLAGADVVYHLAGRIHATSLAEFRAVNAAGVRNMARACARRDSPPTLVLVSSLAAAGPSQAGRPRREDDPAAPISHYGISKLEGEQAARAFAADVPISIVRPPFVFGGGDRASLPLFRMIRRWGMQIIPRGHDLELSLIHVDDFIAALLAIAGQGRRVERRSAPAPAVAAVAETNGVGVATAPAAVADVARVSAGAPPAETSAGVYSPADPTVLTYSEMGRIIGDSVGRSVRVWRMHRSWLWGACAVSAGMARFTGRPGVINFDKLREATATAWTCSNQRCQAELSFTPAAPLEQRLAETAAWYEAAGWV